MSVSFLLVSGGVDTEFVASARLKVVPVLTTNLLEEVVACLQA
jgi:hypothetical protein